MTVQILTGDALEQLRGLPAGSVQCCVTSPPYYGLRDYGTATWEGGDPGCDHLAVPHSSRRPERSRATNQTFHGSMSTNQSAETGTPYRDICGKCGALCKDDGIGLEATPEAHIAALVAVFAEVRRVLRKDGVLWLNYGDAYATSVNGRSAADTKAAGNDDRTFRDKPISTVGHGAKPKELLMLPARVALALQADGWWLRSMLPWVKRSAMPESATDRPATAIEYVFQFTRSGDTTFWQHRDGGAARPRPAPDYRWTDRRDGGETTREPLDWRTEKFVRDGKPVKRWQRVNLWRGSDYFFDMEAVRQNWADDRQGRDGSKQQSERNRGGRTDGYTKPNNIDPSGNSGRNFRNADLFFSSLQAPYGLISDAEGNPLALDVNPAGFAEAHFATFPPKLIEPLIKAATSEKGCCPACAAPWVREVEKGELQPDHSQKTLPKQVNENGRAVPDIGWNREQGFAPNVLRPSKTLGWSPSCGCGGEPVPCTILDCFGGAGTTGLVADRLGRSAVLIELNPEYAEMARARIHKDAPLFAEVGI
ncbi:MAG: site-specific DNA-methyltransferase [Rhodospirillales bacterium]|nr:site-specific DNA-methyltransferase [Rhodospirillales bacterium]